MLILAVMKGRQIQLSIIFGIISLIGILAIQFYWLFTTWQQQQDKLDENIILALKNVSKEVSILHDCLPNDLNPITQLSETCYLVDVSCDFNQKNLEYLISTNFNKLNIAIEHEISVYDCSKNALNYLGKYSSVGNRISDLGALSFCENDKHNELVYYFYINLSGRNIFLIKEMRMWLILSTIVLLIVIFFGYTMFSFFRQRQFAELQKDFIDNMTHEFKTPISSIKIASDVLLGFDSDIVPQRFFNYAKIIKQENERLINQVENVLRAAKIDRGKIMMSIEKLDLHAVLDEIFDDHTFLANEKEVNFTKNMQANKCFINADKLHLTNIIFNLIDNAIKYNDANVNIAISTQNSGNNIELTLSDNGIGIPQKYIKSIFKKFFRVPTGNLHDVKGFGLGLFYVKQVCNLHSWIINISSTENQGSSFSILIPLI